MLEGYTARELTIHSSRLVLHIFTFSWHVQFARAINSRAYARERIKQYISREILVYSAIFLCVDEITDISTIV